MQKWSLLTNMPLDFVPCEDFRRIRDQFLHDRPEISDLADFRAWGQDHAQGHVTTVFRAWLDDTEVSLAIAAVTLAITRHEEVPGQGFGYITQASVQSREPPISSPSPMLRTIRPGRPMLLPIVVEQHTILLIIRLNERGEPEFSVMDSKAYHLGPAHRQAVHAWATKLAQHSQWWEHVFDRGTYARLRPTHMAWLPCAQQPSHNECGYYTILNAWALALGLEPDPTSIWIGATSSLETCKMYHILQEWAVLPGV